MLGCPGLRVQGEVGGGPGALAGAAWQGCTDVVRVVPEGSGEGTGGLGGQEFRGAWVPCSEHALLPFPRTW